MENKCSNCGIQRDGMQKCGKCLVVYYCSRECQKMDWKANHKSECDELKTAGETVISAVQNLSSSDSSKQPSSDPPDHTSCVSCVFCGTVVGKLKKCGRCLNVDYYSKSCQTQHWPNHKTVCKKNKDIIDVIKTDGYNEQLRKSKSDRIRSQAIQCRNGMTSFENGHHMMFGPSTMFRTDSADLSLRRSTTRILRRQAKLYVERKFPMHDIVEDIEEIPHEFPFSFGKARVSFVGFISRYHHYRGRHCVYIQDKNDAEIYTGFYIDYDNPYPYFTWGDVRPGKFICLHDPRIHFFLDGSVGIRVNESSEVFLFDI